MLWDHLDFVFDYNETIMPLDDLLSGVTGVGQEELELFFLQTPRRSLFICFLSPTRTHVSHFSTNNKLNRLS